MQHTRIKLSVILAFTALLASASAQADETLVVSGRFLDVFVDVDHCVTGSVLCTDSGSVGPAADFNDSIVVVVVHVKGPLGNPVGGLLEADFSLGSITNPGGVTPGFVDSLSCPSCFAEPQTGVYRLAARPAILGSTWRDGTYMALLEVTVPSGAVRQTVVPMDIPL
jgi:hypothetical protein